MKTRSATYILTVVSAIASASAQTPAASPPKPAAAAAPQSAKPAAPTSAISDETVVATVNGKKMTAAQVKNMLAATPPQYWRAFTTNPAQFMRDYSWYVHLKEDAEKRGVDKETPYREQLEFQRMMILAQAQHNEARKSVIVQREDERKHYDQNPEKYREAQAKLIYIPFSAQAGTSAGGKKTLTEAEAKAKAEIVARQAKAGGDFVKLVEQHSEDPGSVAQKGDIGSPVRSSTSHIPEPMRKAILALKPGEVSDPVRNENGYYVFRCESSSVLPYEKVREEIYNELQQAGFTEWVKKTRSESTFEIGNEEFFRELAKSVQQPQ